MLSASLHIDCACALPFPRHFLATWRRPSTFSAPSPPMHAGLRCHWCGLPLACANACATACASARVPPWAWARPSVETWRVCGANVSDGAQPRTPSARLKSLETSTAHTSSPATPRRVQPSRVAEPSVIVASSAPSLGRTPTGAEWPYDCGARPRDTSHHTLRISSCRKLVSFGGVRACSGNVRVQKNTFTCEELATVQAGRGLGCDLLHGHCFTLPVSTSRGTMRGACQKATHLNTSKLKELATPPRWAFPKTMTFSSGSSSKPSLPRGIVSLV